MLRTSRKRGLEVGRGLFGLACLVGVPGGLTLLGANIERAKLLRALDFDSIEDPSGSDTMCSISKQ